MLDNGDYPRQLLPLLSNPGGRLKHFGVIDIVVIVVGFLFFNSH